MPVFRSSTQAKMLARVLGDPDRTFSLSDLAAQVDADMSTVSREASRLVDAGVLLEERVGRTRVLRANTASRVFDELRSLALKTFGPAHLAARAFLSLRGVEAVVVFGSWAARHAGEPGHNPRDLDVLLVGEPSRIAANRAAEQLGDQLDLPVGLTFVSGNEWREDTVGVVRDIKAGHHLLFDADEGADL